MPPKKDDRVETVILRLLSFSDISEDWRNWLCVLLVCDRYQNEDQLKLIQPLIDKDLSEPYSIFTYRYFIKQWPDLCYLAMEGEECVGAVVCKLVRN